MDPQEPSASGIRQDQPGDRPGLGFGLPRNLVPVGRLSPRATDAWYAESVTLWYAAAWRGYRHGVAGTIALPWVATQTGGNGPVAVLPRLSSSGRPRRGHHSSDGRVGGPLWAAPGSPLLDPCSGLGGPDCILPTKSRSTDMGGGRPPPRMCNAGTPNGRK